MILESILVIFLNFAQFLVTLFPDKPQYVLTFINLFEFIKKGLYFVDIDVFAMVVNVATTFMIIQLMWSIVEWIYKKIPGVD